MDAKHFKHFVDLFSEMWHKRYQEYIKAHKKRTPMAQYRRLPWVKFKERSRGRKSPYINAPIKYTTHTLATGYLRDSIHKSFRKRGSEFLDIPNPLRARYLNQGSQLQFRHHYHKYPQAYLGWVKTVTERFVSYGFVKSLDRIVEFGEDDWARIADTMIQVYKTGPMEDAIEIMMLYDVL
jgi:hypothetical protein